MKQQAPSIVRGFTTLYARTMREGALSVKDKELVAVGIAVAERCVPCINLHVQKCLFAGATKEEIMEAASVAVVLGGGPAYGHLPAVMDALTALET